VTGVAVVQGSGGDAASWRSGSDGGGAALC